MTKVLALTRYTQAGPSSRYRFYNFQEPFREAGVEMEIKPLFGDDYLSDNGFAGVLAVLRGYLSRFLRVARLWWNRGNGYDAILIEYELFPYVPAWFEALLHRRGVRYLVDYDDAIFHRYDRHRNPLIRALLGGKIAEVMTWADRVIVCNPYLEEYARRHNASTVRIPTVVPLGRYTKGLSRYRRPEEGTFVVGWIGSGSTSPYVLPILPVIERLVRKYPSLRLHLVGFDASLLTTEDRRRCKIEVIPWREDEEIERILRFDVGVMPLPDTPWSRGKCGFKLIQYMACSKPLVASPVGINCKLVEAGVNGFLALHPQEWEESLERLIRDADLRRSMGRAGRAKVEMYYNDTDICRYLARTIRESAERGDSPE